MRVCIHTYIYIYTHTHTHTHMTAIEALHRMEPSGSCCNCASARSTCERKCVYLSF